jgi:hypothetical protein
MMSNQFWDGFLLGAGLVLLVAIVTIRLQKAARTGAK